MTLGMLHLVDIDIVTVCVSVLEIYLLPPFILLLLT